MDLAAREPAGALRDRAERHVFTVLPDLSGVERRALALVELAGVAVEDAAVAVGSADALFRARRALRRTIVPLASGARCDRAERLLSASAPRTLDESRWLKIHTDRCPRCAEHVAALGVAREGLVASFGAAARKAVEATATEAGGAAERSRLRVVPRRDSLERVDFASHSGEKSTRSGRWRWVALVVVPLALVGGAVAALDDSGAPPPTAPWAAPSAPDVTPPPISRQ